MTWLGPALALLVAAAAPGKGVRWERDVDAALRKARKADKPLMVDFFAVWCQYCQRLDRQTYVDPEVVRLSDDFVALKVNTEGASREIDLTRRYDVTSLPTIVFLSPEGRVLLRVEGYQGPGWFPATMSKARAAAQRIRPIERTLEREPEDALALTQLGQHLFEQADLDECRELLHEAVKRDAGLPASARKRSRMYLALVLHDDRKYSQAESLFVDALDLRPADASDAKLLYLLAMNYVDWNRFEQARGTLRRLLLDHPRSPIAPKAREKLFMLERR